VAICNGRLGDADALRDVSLRERRGDAIGIGMTAKRDQEVLPLRGAQGVGKLTSSLGAIGQG
jgi:hypothetical protein